MTDVSTTFAPDDLDCSDFANIEPYLDDLEARAINSADDLKRWLADYADLTEVVSEFGARRRIEHSCHTDDPDIEKAFLNFIQNVSPKLAPRSFALKRKAIDSGLTGELDDAAHRVLFRDWATEVAIYRDENVPLQTKLTELASAYDKLCGAMLIDFQGQTLTLQQMARFLEDTDRTTREQAWRMTADRRLTDREAIDELFEQQLDLRTRVAANASCQDYRHYIWQAYARFDYTPEDCLKFGDTVEASCVPLARSRALHRQSLLGVDTLRPWDMAVDERGRDPLRPFDPSDVDRLVSGAQAVFDRIDPALGAGFAELKPGRNFDLESRKGKRPGGYQSSLERVREPFIFMNAAGLHRDVETMLHEGGHAFHYQASRHLPLVFLRHAPLEFCEVASMSMELLGADHLDAFYAPAEAARAKRQRREPVVELLPWIATIDGFQHWLYTHPGHTRAERAEAWLAIQDRFSSGAVDWTGLEAQREAMWHRQLHLFHYPFYYIEYGIAQLGALQVWMNHRQDPAGALEKLRSAFALGGGRPLPELFEAAGIRFDFSATTVGPLMETIEQELASLPDEA